jgi:polyhydroxybutyrate depolymerase
MRRTRRRVFRAAALAFATALSAAAAQAPDHPKSDDCGADAPCAVEGGVYLVRPPEHWDRHTLLPALVFFHGWRQSAADVMRDEALARVTSDLGVLLIAPDGVDRSWSFPGSPERHRDEFAFIKAVLVDAESRFPIDRRRLWASGFSQGASMVWYVACFMGERFAAFIPIAGDFWRPQPSDCPSGPASIRHIHGLADETFPIEGRVVRDDFRQGNLWQGWALWRQIDGCLSPPDRVETAADLTCRIWPAGSCASGRELALCLHSGGHVFKAEWLEDAYRWVIELHSSGTVPLAGPPAPLGAAR